MRLSRRSSGGIVLSAISLSAITGFLSFSGSTVMCEPLAMERARWADRSTSSNLFGTLSTQSSTVTRAIRRFLLQFVGAKNRHNTPGTMAPRVRFSGRLFACANPEIKGLADTRSDLRGKTRQQSPGLATQNGMQPARRNLRKRHQNERSDVEQRVRQCEAALL